MGYRREGGGGRGTPTKTDSPANRPTIIIKTLSSFISRRGIPIMKMMRMMEKKKKTEGRTSIAATNHWGW